MELWAHASSGLGDWASPSGVRGACAEATVGGRQHSLPWTAGILTGFAARSRPGVAPRFFRRTARHFYWGFLWSSRHASLGCPSWKGHLARDSHSNRLDVDPGARKSRSSLIANVSTGQREENGQISTAPRATWRVASLAVRTSSSVV